MSFFSIPDIIWLHHLIASRTSALAYYNYNLVYKNSPLTQQLLEYLLSRLYSTKLKLHTEYFNLRNIFYSTEIFFVPLKYFSFH